MPGPWAEAAHEESSQDTGLAADEDGAEPITASRTNKETVLGQSVCLSVCLHVCVDTCTNSLASDVIFIFTNFTLLPPSLLLHSLLYPLGLDLTPIGLHLRAGRGVDVM